MDINQASNLASSAVVAAIPLMFAGAGELVAEKSGVLNLGVEGMMLMGAVTGYAVTAITGSPWLGVLAAIGAGLAMSLLFAFLTLTMLANQVATGLSLTIFGIGLSAYVGKPYTSAAVRASIDTWAIPGLSKIPVLGPALFSLTPLDYLAFLMFAVIGWFLYRTRAGLVLRSVGESPQVAHSVGFPVVGVRYGAVAFGGGMAGLAGGYYSIVYLHVWQEQLTSGRGWIALALVVFATWRPGRLLIGALLFGYFLTITQTPQHVTEFLTGLGLERYEVLVLIMLMYIVLGCVMDAMAMVILTIPIIFPVITALGFDPIWFGILVVKMIEIALITPPVGLNVYVLRGALPQVPTAEIFRGTLPFLAVQFANVALILAFPALVLWLPRTMGMLR
jgi:simple sugar transport system permease protein